MAEGRASRTWWRVIGIVAIVLGVIGAVVLWLIAGARYDDAVSGLAPAPVGCETTLDFARTGTFTFFLERRGEIAEIEGDCENDARTYDLDEGDVQRVTLSLVDPDGDEMILDRVDGPTYDRNGSTGDGFRTAEIVDPGEYILTVTSGQDEVVVRVGDDPSSGVAALRISAGALLLAGLGVGALGLAKGNPSSRPPPAPAPAVAVSWPTGQRGWPPVAPPYANPPVPPPYAAPPTSPWTGVPGSGRPLPPPPPPPPPRRKDRRVAGTTTPPG